MPWNPASLANRSTVMVAMLLGLSGLGLGCATGGCPDGEGYRAVACNAAAARGELRYGLSRDEALDAIGRSEVDPPWKNEWDAGPSVIRNPFDTQSYTSKLGEAYEVTRYFVEAWGVSYCPFIQGRLQLEPLIFLEDELVGWSWPYLQDLLGRGLTEDEIGWSFGMFCDRIESDPPATPE